MYTSSFQSQSRNAVATCMWCTNSFVLADITLQWTHGPLLALHLVKALYGLKQASPLLEMRHSAGFPRSRYETCLYICQEPDGTIKYLLVYVDVTIIATLGSELAASVQATIGKKPFAYFPPPPQNACHPQPPQSQRYHRRSQTPCIIDSIRLPKPALTPDAPNLSPQRSSPNPRFV